MKFGKLDSLVGVDFTLPLDHPDTAKVLNGIDTQTQVYQGGTMWNIPEWLGKIYQEKTRKADFISAYGQQFSTIELNATHYRIPTKETVVKWSDSMPDDFVFCPKFPQSISHYRRFNNCDDVTDQFLEVIHYLGKKLSTSFIQLPPNYSAKKGEELVRYLEKLPRDMRFAIEFRNEDWFDGNHEAEATWQSLRSMGIGSVITDTGGRRDAVHMRLTTPDCIVRFGGNELDPTDYTRIDAWISRISSWKRNGLESFQLWMHQPNSVLSPETCIYFSEKLKATTGLECKRPRLLNNTLTLF